MTNLFSPFFNAQSCPELYQRTTLKLFEDRTCDLFLTNQVTEIIAKILTPDNCIAGSAALATYCQGSHFSDIDIYSLSEESCRVCFDRLRSHGYSVDYYNPFGFIMSKSRYKKKVNLVKFAYYDSFKHVLDTFDWTVCQFAISQDCLIFNPSGLRDFYEKRLNIHRLIFYMDIKNRLNKYQGKGYVPTEICQKAIKEAINLEPMRKDVMELFNSQLASQPPLEGVREGGELDSASEAASEAASASELDSWSQRSPSILTASRRNDSRLSYSGTVASQGLRLGSL